MSQIQFEEAIKTIEPGLYKHFKGNYYEVLCIARHSETTEPMVVYRALYGDRGIWTRPAYMWNETVEHDGQTVTRFRKLDPVERVSFYEELFDEVNASGGLRASDSEANLSADFQTSDIGQKIQMLDDYYTSGQWLKDYEADEQGLLSGDLKRGVLSQDALFDLLSGR